MYFPIPGNLKIVGFMAGGGDWLFYFLSLLIGSITGIWTEKF
jgi:hypothetical protein